MPTVIRDWALNTIQFDLRPHEFAELREILSDVANGHDLDKEQLRTAARYHDSMRLIEV